MVSQYLLQTPRELVDALEDIARNRVFEQEMFDKSKRVSIAFDQAEAEQLLNHLSKKRA